MSHESRNFKTRETTDSIITSLRLRIGLLLLASMATVAVVFGSTFYFALVSNESAVARQIPELTEVASKLKNLLVANTFGFMAVIIVSIYILARIITDKTFHPLGELQEDIAKLGEGKALENLHENESGPFASLFKALHEASRSISEREKAEIEELNSIAEKLSNNALTSGAAASIREVAKRRASRELKNQKSEKKPIKDSLVQCTGSSL